MNRLAQVLSSAGLNGVLLSGVIWAGWSDGTAISLFWCENALMIPLISLRIILHRRATNKRGHYVSAKVRYNNGPWETRTITFNRNFLQIIGFLTFVLGVFVAAAVFLVNKGSVDIDALSQGVAAAAFFLVAGLGLDMIGLRKRPFAWLSGLQERALRRNVLLWLALLVGLPLTAWLEKPKIIFGIFGGLKLFFDVAGLFPQYDPPEAPSWMVRVFGRDFAEFWRRDSLQQRHKTAYDAAACEEIYDGRPMGDMQ